MYMSEQEYQKKLSKIQRNNEQKLRRRNLRKERFKYFPKFKLPSTSKLVLLGVFFMCFEVVAFSQYAMIALGDTSALYALIGVPAAIIPVCLGYFSKAKAENTAGGITYETAINQHISSDEDVVG